MLTGPLAVIAAYRYNGQGQRIGVQIDTDADGTLETNADDPWSYRLYNERWQLVAESDAASGASGAAAASDFDRVTVYHAAGLGGGGSSSYIDSMILIDADTTSSGLFDERTYLVQNWRHDVVATATPSGDITSMQDYTPFGEPVEVLQGDIDKDGVVDLDDFSIYSSQFGVTDWDTRTPVGCTADLDRDGEVTADDFALMDKEWLDTYRAPAAVINERELPVRLADR